MTGASSIPGGWRDVAFSLDSSVAEKPDAEALVGRFARYSFSELDQAINAPRCRRWA
jgi:hypothetical protein